MDAREVMIICTGPGKLLIGITWFDSGVCSRYTTLYTILALYYTIYYTILC